MEGAGVDREVKQPARRQFARPVGAGRDQRAVVGDLEFVHFVLFFFFIKKENFFNI